MSYELLLVAGPGDAAQRARRSALVEHAAKNLPGAVSQETAEVGEATIALAHTAPACGSFARLERGASGVTACVAVSPSGLTTALAAALDGTGTALGSEAGHLTVTARPDGSVVVTTDGTAFVPCYWGEHDGSLYVSTHLASLVSLGLPPDTDEQGVLEYLVLMHPWEHRTLLRHARLLPPGGTLEWNPRDGVRLRAEPLYLPSDDTMSDDEALATFRRLWPEIIGDLRERTAGRRPALGLSGGLDSRAIAVGAAQLGWRPQTYTYGTVRNHETKTAMLVANRLGLPQQLLPVTDEHLLANARHIVDVLDGAHGPGEMYELWFDDALRSFADVIVNGLVSGPLWGDDKTVGLTDRAAIAAHLNQRFAGAMSSISPYLADDVRPGLREVISRGIDESLAPWDFTQRADMTLFWKQANKLLRWGNMLTNALRRAGLGLEAPFLDHRFLQFAARLTPEQRLNGNLYLRVHREALSATADIPRSDDGNSPRALNHVYWSAERSFVSQMVTLTRHNPIAGLRRGGRRAVHVGASMLRQRTSISGVADHLDDRASVFPADLWLRTRPRYAERLASLLESAAGSGSPLLSDTAISQTVDSLRAGRAPSGALPLTRVAAAGLWLQDYTHRAKAAQAAGY